MKIAILGAQNSGKTTLIKQFESNSDVVTYHNSIGSIIKDINNKYPFTLGINQYTCNLTQSLIANYYDTLMNNFVENDKVNIYDRCILDTLIYYNFDLFNDPSKLLYNIKHIEISYNNNLKDSVIKSLSFFDKFIFLETGAHDLVDNNIRNINYQFLKRSKLRYKKLYSWILNCNFYNSLNVKYFNVIDIKENKHISYLESLINANS